MSGAAFLLALLAAASDPPGTLQSTATQTYPSASACRFALESWAARVRADERHNPTVAPSTWRLDGPEGSGDLIAYRSERISRMTFGSNLHTVAYFYAHSCDGAVYTSVADGWTRDEPLPPSSEKN